MRTLVVAPHPDDELLGCGGTLLRRQHQGDLIGYLLMTAISEASGWTSDQVAKRKKEIDAVRSGLGVKSENLFELGFDSACLDRVPMSTLVSELAKVFREFEPEEVLVPFSYDAHSDHRITYDAAAACSKWFRYPSVRRVMAYETLSETDFGLDPHMAFSPNFFVDIGPYLDSKLSLLEHYESELGDFPFPRSITAVRALATLRGAQSGFLAAEAFQLLRERN